jgi:DNA-directed RNA polymerase subunit M/transcription elongation factor TFIIS
MNSVISITDMTTKLHFCPKCDTLLKYDVTDAATSLVCSNCSYNTPLSSGQNLKTSIYGSTLSTLITKAAAYDPSLRLSSNIVCPNKQCDTNKVELLGTYNANGQLIQPEVCVSNNNSVSRINTYICRICRTVFTPE